MMNTAHRTDRYHAIRNRRHGRAFAQVGLGNAVECPPRGLGRVERLKARTRPHLRACSRRVLTAICATTAFAAALGAAAQTQPPPATASRPTSRPGLSDEDLARRLQGRADTTRDPFRRALELMEATSHRLADEYDTGEQTRTIQSDILKALDEAIRAASRPPTSGQRGGKGQTGESRGAGRRSSQRPGEGAAGARSTPGDAAGGGKTTGSAPGESAARLADRADVRRGWGYLPDRDREAIVQGVNEEFHPRYREQIEDYYRAIAEQAEREP